AEPLSAIETAATPALEALTQSSAQSDIRSEIRSDIGSDRQPTGPASLTSALPATVASPNVASPNVASPNVASPNVASPNAASPNVASPNQPAPSPPLPRLAQIEQPAPEPAPEPLPEAEEDASEDKLERLLEGINRQPEAAPEEPAAEDPTAPEQPPAAQETPPETQAEEDPPEETQVLVSEVAVESESGEPLPPDLLDSVYNAAMTQPGRTTTRSGLQEDINNIFATGFFANVRAFPQDTPLGVRVTFVVQPNPVLSEVVIRENQVLPPEVIDEIFSPLYGRTLNLVEFQGAILGLNDWYQENGYVLAQVTAAPQVSQDGVVTLVVAEGVIEEIEVRYITLEGDDVDEEGNPIDGRTQPFIVTREFETQPGEVFQDSAIRDDLQRVFGLGIFDDVRLSLDPGDEDPRKVKVVVNVAERNTGSVGAAVGFNLTGDIFGSVSYQEDNFGGNNQKLRTEFQLSSREFLFDVSFTDPWIGGDPNRTSYTVNGFNRRSRSLIFDGGEIEVDLANGDDPRINRWGGGLTFSRPLSETSSASVGFDYQRVASLDGDGDLVETDELGNPLTFSGDGRDDLFTIPVGFVLDQRNDSIFPTSGSLLRLGTEQSVPLGNGSIFFNRLRGSYSYYVPVNVTGFGDGPETIALNLQAGTVIGDLPPYEAFSLGGTNSVRGFDEGDLGSGRSFIQATAEYRFPLFTEFLGGALFLDYATDLGSGDTVPGNPAGARGKPGSGFGYGAGVRVQTPLGQLRLDFGLNDEGDSRIHFGFGERF
ncbi:MAG: BamA/TamA family outer membrane protein, partial [Cyanobacteria bacterium P01_F01_bin.4]